MSIDIPVISCKNVWKIFGPDPKKFLNNMSDDMTFEEIRAAGYISGVRDVSIDVNKGEMLVIMGLSGSGKSTLVRCFSRLHDVTGGTIAVEGQDIVSMSENDLIELRRSKMGMVFQSFGLLPHRTVLQNVASLTSQPLLEGRVSLNTEIFKTSPAFFGLKNPQFSNAFKDGGRYAVAGINRNSSATGGHYIKYCGWDKDQNPTVRFQFVNKSGKKSEVKEGDVDFAKTSEMVYSESLVPKSQHCMSVNGFQKLMRDQLHPDLSNKLHTQF